MSDLEMKTFIAHKREDGTIQTIQEHDEAVAKRASAFSVASYKDVVYNSGILHDIGKYQNSFQERIRGKNLRVDHSTAGAIEAYKLPNFASPVDLIMEYIIAGHHAGIPNGGTRIDMPGEGINGSSLSARLKKETLLEDYSVYQSELADNLKAIDHLTLSKELSRDCRSMENVIDKFAFVVRLCYSCLVDADSLDTEYFCKQIERDTLHSDFQSCLSDINHRFQNFLCSTPLQKARSVLQQQAYNNIEKHGEVYMMNMPTGSGKTLCGTKCALVKAIQEHKKRIIYVIPYNSIISQTADELAGIFGEHAHILRHQSTYTAEDDENVSEEYKIRIQQATENWDANLIITTMVQFFETAFSNKRSKLRKMHNMIDSVLIFDEAHLMPLEYLQPCLETIAYLTRYANCSAIFLTATMPDYEALMKKYTFQDIQAVNLIPDKAAFQYFKKCRYKDIGMQTEESLLAMCETVSSALLIVNSRAEARQLYQTFSTDQSRLTFHLSTYMTKIDIDAGINRIRSILFDQSMGRELRQLIVISTSLIEAGVDLDFDTVFREYSGLDSILQAGGRCNREGKRPYGNVYIFGLERGIKIHDNIRTAVTKSLLKEHSDISSPDCVQDYFHRVYLTNQDEITRNAMYNCNGGVTDIRSVPFADYDGKIIKDTQQSVIVPESETAENIVSQIQYTGLSRKNMRFLQKYSCSVPQSMFEELLEEGVLEDYGTGVYVLTNMDYYEADTGIHSEGRDYFI